MPQTVEQYVVTNSIVNGITAADSLYCANPGESERCNNRPYMDALADSINEKVSQNQLENTISVLELALNRRK